ncbi:MAG: YlmC/YmxH family sporulation protein [Clostridia bacterium]|nr:YlmC/YmxH family sporulation protein [Clostridia bacterium]
MEITFEDIKNKEIINIFDGRKLGHASDLTFDKQTSRVLGISVPGEKRLFRKAEQIFIPIENIKKIGEDVCLVKIAPEGEDVRRVSQSDDQANRTPREVYARYKRVVEKEK